MGFPNYGNYPPGVTGCEDHLTGRYYCPHCTDYVAEGEHHVTDSHGGNETAVCGTCADHLAVCDHCIGLFYKDDGQTRWDADNDRREVCCCDCYEEDEDE